MNEKYDKIANLKDVALIQAKIELANCLIEHYDIYKTHQQSTVWFLMRQNRIDKLNSLINKIKQLEQQ